MKTDKEAIEIIQQIEGNHIESIVENAMFDSCVIGICMNDGCEFTTEYEHDQNKGWCEECDTGTVKSAMLLLGVI